MPETRSAHLPEGVELRRSEERVDNRDDPHGPATTLAQSGYAREQDDGDIDGPHDVDRRDYQDQPARERAEAEPENPAPKSARTTPTASTISGLPMPRNEAIGSAATNISTPLRPSMAR